MKTKYIILFILTFSTTVIYCQEIMLKDYAPHSIYRIPQSKIEKAKYPVIDVHSHAYPTSEEEIMEWVENMDRAGIEKTILLTGAVGEQFDSLLSIYSKFNPRFDLWCGLDISDYGKQSFLPTLLRELERCHANGAQGVGELTDKGLGIYLASQKKRADGLHLNDPLMTAVYNKCAELNMPLNVHVADPYWMYLPIDEKNDGLMNASEWEIDTSVENIRLHDELMVDFKSVLENHPETTFIACHFMNCSYDLSILAGYLDSYPNLYADLSARLGETGSIPRYMNRFLTRYSDRILFGTDNGFNAEMYHIYFRFLETDDEHFYVPSFNYHWNYSGFHLPDEVLGKIYSLNAKRILTN